jgi:hypothetical protein
MTNNDFELLKFNLKRIIKVCKQAQNQTKASGLKLS